MSTQFVDVLLYIYFFFFFYIQTVPTAYFKSESNKIAFILFSHTDGLISTAEPGTQSIARERARSVDCDSVRFCSGFVNIVRSFDHVRIGYVVKSHLSRIIEPKDEPKKNVNDFSCSPSRCLVIKRIGRRAHEMALTVVLVSSYACPHRPYC